MRRYWTRERIILSLKQVMNEIPGALPNDDREYNRLRKGREDWPPTVRVLGYFHSISRAWLAAGAPKSRVNLSNIAWTPEEDGYLLENAGYLRLKTIAANLCRTPYAVRSRLNKYYGIRARDNQGFLSASALSKEYDCPYSRVISALKSGLIKGDYDPVRNMWKVDLGDITPEAEAVLRAPKERSWRTYPPDLGDYDQRYNLHRQVVDGKARRVGVFSEVNHD